MIPIGPRIPHSNKSGISLNVAVPNGTTVVRVATQNSGNSVLIAFQSPSKLASSGFSEYVGFSSVNLRQRVKLCITKSTPKANIKIGSMAASCVCGKPSQKELAIIQIINNAKPNPLTKTSPKLRK